MKSYLIIVTTFFIQVKPVLYMVNEEYMIDDEEITKDEYIKNDDELNEYINEVVLGLGLSQFGGSKYAFHRVPDFDWGMAGNPKANSTEFFKSWGNSAKQLYKYVKHDLTNVWDKLKFYNTLIN